MFRTRSARSARTLQAALAAFAVCFVAAPAPARTPALAEKPADERGPRERRILFFSASWCGPCARVKGDLHHPERTPQSACAELQREGWKIGHEADAHLQIVDFDRSPQLVRQYNVHALPTFVLIEADREIKRIQGAVGSKTLAALYATN